MTRGAVLWPATFLLATSLLFAACGRSIDSGHTNDPSVATRTSGESRYESLPFDSTFTKRWNSANDGTDYEPCVAASAQILSDLGVDPTSVRDAAGTDGQTLRGCDWEYRGDGGARWTVSQIVGDSEGLASYKRRYQAGHWRDDLDLAGRTVGVIEEPDFGNCGTYVQSGASGVHTIVFHRGRPHPATDEVCERALAFTRATIGQMPP